MNALSRRSFMKRSAALGAVGLAAAPHRRALAAGRPGSKMKLGLVTYLWGKDWDLPTLIRNCERAKVLGVELRTTHKHGVEIRLNAEQRREVKRRAIKPGADNVKIVPAKLGSDAGIIGAAGCALRRLETSAS